MDAEPSERTEYPRSPGPRPVRLRYCPMEPGELVSDQDCSRCPHRPEPPDTICAVSRPQRRPRSRGFWDAES